MRALPGPGAGDFDWLTFRQAGVITTDQAEQFHTPGIVRGRVRQGRWRRLCRGILLTENGRLHRDQQLWVAVLVSGRDAHLAGWTAATEGGVQGVRADPIKVLVPADRCRSIRLPRLPEDMPAVQTHRTTVFPQRHRQIGSPPRTTVARAVIDGAAWAPNDNEARELIVRSCQQGRTTVASLREVLRRFPMLRRRRLILQTIDGAEGGAAALSEIDLVRLCRRHGLPLPDLQRIRTDATDRRRYVDAHWASSHLLVEIDGGHHMDAQYWAADMLRQNQIWIAGDRILRFPAWLVRSDPAAVAAQLREALIAAGHPTLVGSQAQTTERW
jgi:very-short-patch-repair endonuclease